MKTSIKYTVYADEKEVLTFDNLEDAKKLENELKLRRSGRTTKSLKRAINIWKLGETVRYIVPSNRMIFNVHNMLLDLLKNDSNVHSFMIDQTKEITSHCHSGSIKVTSAPEGYLNNFNLDFTLIHDHTYWESNE